MNHFRSLCLLVTVIFVCLGKISAESRVIHAWDELDRLGANKEFYRDLPIPFFQLPRQTRAWLYSILPVRSVGSLIMKNRPFHGTISYLDFKDDVPLFSTSAHLGDVVKMDRGVDRARFWLGDAFDEWVEVKLERTPVWTNIKGDISILKASWGQRRVFARLRTGLRPIRMSRVPVSAFVNAPDVKFFVVGRAVPAHTGRIMKALASQDLWSRQMRGMYELAFETEAPTTKHSFGGEGDVLMVGAVRILDDGRVTNTLDPDGLVVGSNEGAAFEASSTGWRVDSFVTRIVAFGGMSGSPVLAVFPDGTTYQVGIEWTGHTFDPVKHIVDTNPALGQVEVKNGKLSLRTQGYGSSMASAISSVAAEMKHEKRELFQFLFH